MIILGGISMHYQKLLEYLNIYAKKIMNLIYIHHREYFGREDDLFLFSLITSESPLIKFTTKGPLIERHKKEKNIPELFINLSHPKIFGKTEEEKKEFLESLIPFEIFYFIVGPLNNAYLVNEEEQAYHEFLKKGFSSVLAKEFSQLEHVPVTILYPANQMFAEKLLKEIPAQIDTKKMMYQNDIEYITELYKMTTGKNLRKDYKENYIKENERDRINTLLKKYIVPEQQEQMEEKIMKNGTYAKMVLDLTSYFVTEKKDKELEAAMQEFQILFPNYLNENMSRERKKENGFFKTSVVIMLSIFLGIILLWIVNK